MTSSRVVADRLESGSDIVLFHLSGARSTTEAVRAALAIPLLEVADRRALEGAMVPGRCVIACMSAPSSHDLLWLSRLIALRPECPLIWVAPLSSDAGRLLAEFGAPLPPVVWVDEIDERLSSVVREIQSQDPVRRLMDSLVEILDPPPVLGHAVRKLGKVRPPIHSVRALAEQVGVIRWTLGAHWSICSDGVMTLKALLDWVVLARAAELSSRSVTGMAFGVGIHRRTLDRIARRRLGVTTAALRRMGPEAVVRVIGEQFRAVV